MSAREAPVLEVDGIGKAFGRQEVLKAGAFSARSGRIGVLMGRNGAGKSTLLRIAVGAVRADYGRVLYRGEFLRRSSLASLARRGLMFLPQEGILTPSFTVGQHLEGVAAAFQATDRIEGVVEELMLSPILDRGPRGISGGERQRAALGVALLRSPECLLMDEPFVGIDPKARELVAGGLLRLRSEGCAIVISGHDVDDLFQVADEVLWVTAGTTHWLGSPDRAREYAQFRREYLGP